MRGKPTLDDGVQGAGIEVVIFAAPLSFGSEEPGRFEYIKMLRDCLPGE